MTEQPDHRPGQRSGGPPAGDRRAFLGLGTNLGDRWGYLRAAVRALDDGPIPLMAVSAVYETDPMGGPDGQGPFLNLVAEVVLTEGQDPRHLLVECQRLESLAERVREVRWGPRTLDVDVLWIDGVVLDDPELTVPHPRWRERRFVLAPLAELAPELVDQAAIETAGGEVRVVGRV